MNNKRKKVTDELIKYFNTLDPTGYNSRYYKDRLSKMSDTEFDKMMKKFRDEEDTFLRIYIIPFKNDLKMDNIKKTAKQINVPLFEKVALPYVTEDKKRVIWTKEKVPVGYVHIKMLEQMVSKKNTMSISTSKRNPVTGQVTANDKNGRASDMENISYITIEGTDNIIKEFNGPRSDNMEAKLEMYNKIKNEGMVSLKDIKTSKANSVALNTLDAMFLACGIKTDLITNGLLLKKTMMKNKDNSVINKDMIK